MEAQASGGGPSRGVNPPRVDREIGRWFLSIVTQGHHSDPHPQRSPRLRESRRDQSWCQHGATSLTTAEPPMERYHRARLEIPPTPGALFLLPPRPRPRPPPYAESANLHVGACPLSRERASLEKRVNHFSNESRTVVDIFL